MIVTDGGVGCDDGGGGCDDGGGGRDDDDRDRWNALEFDIEFRIFRTVDGDIDGF